MRAFKRYDKRGFTLVELMIVVAIIGVLAALAIYGVTRYLASAKAGEAKNTVGAIARGAAAAYERETTDSELLLTAGASAGSSHSLCNSSTLVPAAAPPSNSKYQPDTTPNTDFDTGDSLTGWKCLKFNLSQPMYYQYGYIRGDNGTYFSNGLPGAPTNLPTDDVSFEAGAQGNLDGDANLSTFARSGSVVNGQLVLATQVFIHDEYE